MPCRPSRRPSRRACLAALTLAFAPLAVALTPNIVFNQTLSPMDAVLMLDLGPWEEVFPDLEHAYEPGLVGVGPMRLWTNSSQWSVDAFPRVRIYYVGTEFYFFGYREDNGSTTAGPRDTAAMMLWWDSNRIEGNTTGSATPDEHGRLGLLADSLAFSRIPLNVIDEPQTPLSSAGNASAYETVGTHNLDPGRIGAHMVRLGVNYYERKGGDNLAISHAVVTCMMQSDAKTFDDVPKQTLPFNLNGRPNPAFTFHGEPLAMSHLGGVGGQEAISHPYIDLRTGTAIGYPSITIPVPLGTGFVILRGVRGPNHGLVEVAWTPLPPYGRETYSSMLDMNATYVYPGSIMHMMALEPNVNYTLTATGYSKFDSVTFYGVGNDTTDPNRDASADDTTPSSPPPSGSPASSGDKKLSAGAIAGIAIGAVAGLVLVILLAYCVGRRRSKPAPTTEVDPGKFEIDETETQPTPFPPGPHPHLTKTGPPRPFNFAFLRKGAPNAAPAPSPVPAAPLPSPAAQRTKNWVATGFTPSPSEVGPPKPFPSAPPSVMSGTTLTPSQAASGRAWADALATYPHPSAFPPGNACLDAGAHSHHPVAEYELRTPGSGQWDSAATAGTAPAQGAHVPFANPEVVQVGERTWTVIDRPPGSQF